MNAPQGVRPVFGKVDAQGRLVEADPPLLRLHQQAGGVTGGMIALPQLGQIARLSRRLGIPIARQVIAASDEQDVALWVSVRPAEDDDGVVLAITGWQENLASQPTPATEAVRWRDFGRAAADWIVETDAMLRIAQSPPNLPATIGAPVETLLSFSRDAEGLSSIVAAAMRADRFEDGEAHCLLGRGVAVRVAGMPSFGANGGFAGYQLLISRRDAPLPPKPVAAGGHANPPPLDAAFGTALGQAMREPLDRIIAHADSISDRGDGPVRRDYASYADDIAGAGRHLLALVEDLVDLQTIERPDFRPEAEAVDLIDASARAAGLLAVRADLAQVRVIGPAWRRRPALAPTLVAATLSAGATPPAMAGDPAAANHGVSGPMAAQWRPIPDPSASTAISPIVAHGDFRRILQVLINLLSNAIRHTPPGGTVRIDCAREGDIAAVIVADEGEGIAPEDQERVFDRFERLGLQDGTGSGLGLYISRRLARAMGGELGVDSAPGKGARFVLTLPISSR
ncbi:MAG: sensor histidine kinase [Rhizorhabdus sp.]|uniref:sensor histidine kinase n=1 Tax=Rhizorhabdus sp. TaxID=1968843 RepID=UPI001B64FE5D|nr:ATP-binding protein [Rhizorhabdus sp.]MBP8230813.1 sensor histidine kinase [Rhizorhabdus sp.]